MFPSVGYGSQGPLWPVLKILYNYNVICYTMQGYKIQPMFGNRITPAIT